MKKHLFLNQSFGTVGSPNQTDETLTRENRIGLMAYLRRTLMLLFAVLTLSIANIGMVWGDVHLYDAWIKASFNGSSCAWDGDGYHMYSGGPNATVGTAAQMGVLTGDFVINDFKVKINSNYKLTSSNHKVWCNVDGSDNYKEYIEYWGASEGDQWPSHASIDLNMAHSTDPSGYHSLNVGFISQFQFSDGWETPQELKTYYFSYTVLPPAVSSFTVTPTGAVSGSGTSGDPYIVPYGGDLKLTMSGSQGHSDANSSAKYYNTSNASSWTTQNYKTISNVTATSNQSVTIKMCYENNDHSELHGTESSSTIYYKAAKGVSVYKFVPATSGLGTEQICTNTTAVPLTVANNKLSVMVGGTLNAKSDKASGSNHISYNNNSFKVSGADSWFVLGLDNKIKAGDVIRYRYTDDSSNTIQLSIRTATGTSTNQINLPGTSTTKGIIQTVAITDAQATAFASSSTVYLLRTGSNTAYLDYFEILRPYKVTLNASTNSGKVEGENTKIMYFAAGEPQLLPRATKSSNRFKGWYTASDNDTRVLDYYTATADNTTLYAQFDACTEEGTLYKFQVKSDLTTGNFSEANPIDLNEGNYLTALIGGTLVGNRGNSNNYITKVNGSGIQIKDNSGYLKIDLDCALQAGDTIKTIVTSKTAFLDDNSSRQSTPEMTIAISSNTSTYQKQVIAGGSNLIGKSTVYIYKGSGNCDVLYFEVIRPEACTPITPTWSTAYTSTILTLGGGNSSTPAINKDGSAGAITWTSSNTGVATVNSSGVVTPKKVGTATITATVAAAGDKCEGSVSVDFTIKGTITYNANTGSGSVPTDASTYAKDAKITVAGKNTLTKADCAFAGWNTKANGSGDWYIPGEKITMGESNITLYAQWATCISTSDFSGRKAAGYDDASETSSDLKDTFSILNKLGGSTTYDNSSGYTGLKLRNSGDWIGFAVAAGSSVTVTTQTVSTSPTVTIDFSSATTLSANTNNVYAADNSNIRFFRIKAADGAAVVINKISIGASCTTNPTVTAGSNSAVTTTTATVSCASGISSLGSAGCSITSYGFVIGTSANPAIGGSGVTQHQVGTSYASTGTSFSKNLTGLTAGTTYYVRPYATNGNGTAYGDQTSFTTTAAATYTVTYNAQGGSVTPTSETVSTATLPTPTKSGYTFDGWYTSGGSKITGTYNPTADITLYAQWQEICVGSGEKDTIKIGVSSSTSYAASFTSSHKSTHTTASATAFTTGGSTATSNSTYDKATAPYSVKFKPSSNINTDEWSDNYSVSASFSVASGYTFTPTRISATIVTEAADYTYRALLTDGVTTYTSSDVSSSANGKFTFSFSSLSGTALSGTITFKVQYKSTAKNTKYFVFNLPIEIDGIVTASGGGGGASCYYVTYNGNGATGGYTTDEAAYASGDNATAATNSFTKTGYTFKEWRTNADGTGTKYDAGDAIAISGNTTLHAIWQAAGYTLAWNTNGGSALAGDYSSGSFADGVAITAPTDPTLSNYTFNSWNTAGDGTGNAYTGTMPAANTTYYAVWGQTVTLDANTENHGSLAGSATAILGRAGLTGITHATPASGYKLTGYYTAKTEGTKVLNSDGTFASSNVTGYITDGKWTQATSSSPTLYAQYEASGSLKWNLGVKTTAESLTTSSKESSFTEISTSNMSNATVYGVTYTASSKNNLTGQISTPAAYDPDKYVYVTFKVADGYKFTPSSISVKVQPVGENEHKAVKLSLADATNTLVSGSPTKCDGTSSGKTTTVTLDGNGTYFTGTVTLKIYVYADETASATTNNCYRLGTPIEIQGAVEATCVMPSFTGLDYIQSSYTVEEEASAISVTGALNVTSYLWKQNSTNDRSGITPASGTNDEASYTPPTGAAGTMYYWCELTNACGTVKTPAVGITVSVSKSDATISWTGTSASANYGGGGYTVKATVNETGWDGNAADLVITAPAGIRIYNVSSGTTSSQKWVQADFDVQTSFDRTTYASNIPFTVSAAATASYNAISNDHNVSYSACAGAGEGATYNLKVRKTTTKDGNYYYWANTDGWISMNPNSSFSSEKASSTYQGYDSVYNTNGQQVFVRTYHANINKVRIYADFRANNMTVSNVYKHTTYFSAESKYEISADDYTAVYNGDEENTNLGDAANGYVDIILNKAMSENDILLVKFNTSRVRPYGAKLTESSAGSLNTHLQWSNSLADKATVNKSTTDAYFTYSASMITENTNSLGAITYSSSVPSVATVDATGKVAMVAAGTTTIKATLAASGCYKKAEISYTLNVSEPVCSIAAGTLELTSGSETKCEGNEVTLTLTDFESGATLQWKDGDTDVNHNGSTYKIATVGTTRTLTTNQPGTYSVIVTKDDCFVRSNRITITNKSTSVHVTRLVKEWYIKNGRLTPDIALWELGDNCSFVSVAASDGWDAGTDLTEAELGEKVFYEKDGIVYMKGTEPKANAEAVHNYTLTLTVNDGCGNQTLTEEGKKITIHHQQNTDKHVLAFVVNGTGKGDWTAGVTADQTTNVGLYNAIAAQFDVQATNIYSTDDEQKLREYYSQYDILCITDYPNTKTKGVNSKSYVDAIGALIDIRPILTMEAYVSSLANWRAKGISGNPKSPTTRQYTMDLQCKDHEIFSGTDLTKVGEGDEAMYRVSMVDSTKEDYATLDATYGAILPHKEKESEKGAGDAEYNYGGKPALQGFTFTEEMSNNDLLPIGLIGDGAGNPLQVGIERQHNMEARLMVLGINSYAMERLTDDGEKVVINALNYLMKKNAEDIADCSTSFVGGAEGDTKNWDNKDNWTGNTVPLPSQKVRILAPCVVPAGVKAHVAGVLIAPNGKYNREANSAEGSLTIAAGGALVVDGKIQAVTAPAYNRPRTTSSGDLAVLTDADAQGALIFDNSEGETQATVQMYSPSYWEIMEGTNKKKSYWSYVAIPIQDAYVGEFFYGAVTYLYDETAGWIRKKIGTHLHAFEGIGLSLPEGHTETFYGPLAPTEDRTVTLTKTTSGGNGENLIGNSWTAPIQIANFEASDFGSANQNVMIYSTGRDGTQDGVRENAEYVTATADNDGSVTAGQWVSIPINVPSLDGYDGLKVIPAMQAFQVTTGTETSLTLNYDKLVRDVNIVSDNLTEKQHAPARRSSGAKKSLMSTMRVRVSGVKTRTDVWLLEDDRFSDEFDNGWEAKYAECDDRSAQLYAQSETGNMSFLAKPDIEGTVLGFAPSKDGNQYLFTFHYVGDDEYYLNDLKLTTATLINDWNSYLFTYEEGDTNRFYISRQPLGAPAVATGVDNPREEAKPRKFIYNNKMYILFNGRVFDATGKVVK